MEVDMHRFLLGLCFLIPTALPQSAPALTPTIGADTPPVIYRSECFGHNREDIGLRSRGLGAGGSTGRLGGLGSKGTGSGASGYGAGAGSVARAPSMAPQSRPAPAPQRKVSQKSSSPIASGPPSPSVSYELAAEDSIADIADFGGVQGVPYPVGSQRQVDWGGTIYLSNDDSMSLASAQRTLFAVENGRRWTPDQIRPHELLNYFSFDTEQPRRNELFQVVGSAEYTAGDELSVAFAVKGATPDRQPLDLTMLIDRSCSMDAEGRMDYTKRGLHVMEGNLRVGDRIDVVLFDDRVCTPLENYVVGRDNPNLLRQTIDNMTPRGSTDLDSGLKESYRLAKSKPNASHRNRRIIVMTDAFLNTGDVNHHTVSEIGAAFENDNIRLTGVGVGRDFNDDVLNKLTEKGKGAYVYLGSEVVVDRVFGLGFDSLVQTIAHDVHFRLDLPKSLAMERFYGEESSTNKADVQPINYYAGTSQLFLQDLKASGVRNSDNLKLTVEYTDANTGRKGTQTFDLSVGQLLGSDKHNVRKARTLMAWTDILLNKAMTGQCGDAVQTYADRAGLLSNDAEIAYVNQLVEKTCGERLTLRPYQPTYTPQRVNLKVKVDSDIPIAEVALMCGGHRQTERLTSSDTVAQFNATSGTCDLTLYGNVAMTTAITVPHTGADVRCIVRGGRMNCS
jgi:Ca-activated chloride channel family protein